MHKVVIKVYNCSGSYTIEGKGPRPTGWCLIRRLRRRGETDRFRTTRRKIVDRGAASQHVAHGVAMSMARREEAPTIVENVDIDIGDLGTFPNTDEGRDAYLSVVREKMRAAC